MKDGQMPGSMLTAGGYLTPPMMALLEVAFGFERKYMAYTRWKSASFHFGAITLYRTILFNHHYNNNRLTNPQQWLIDWAGLIAHEQQHRQEIGNFWSAIGWYAGYGIEYISTGFSYYNMKHEQRAYGVEREMRKLVSWNDNAVLKVLLSDGSDAEKEKEIRELVRRYKEQGLS